MKTVKELIQRNVKLFFCDKGMFFTSLITPMILILLFVTFLGQVYRDSFLSSIPEGIKVENETVNGFVFGWLFSSLLAVCTVTISFCSNLLMVQDKANKSRLDFDVSPINSTQMSIAYFIASAISTLIICITALAICLVILAFTGWYLTFADIALTLCDTVLLVLFGTALSSIIGYFLSTQAQISAVGTIISSAYGFICGAYMPISQFAPAIRGLISYLPGTYGTSLLHRHLMQGVYGEVEKFMPTEAMTALKTAFDSEIKLGGKAVSEPAMYIILIMSVAVLTAVYILLCSRKTVKK